MVYRSLLLFFFLLIGCAETPSDEKTIRLNLFTDPVSLDPRIPKDTTSTTVISMLFEGLTRIDAKGKPSLAAAETVDISTDGKTYTFHLRPTLWTNGRPVTADHFACAWLRILDPNYPASHAYHLFVIKNARAAKKGEVGLDKVGIEVVDDSTLRVELEHPTPYFLDLVSSTLFYPIFPGWTARSQQFISNGPFRFVKWEPFKELVVEKNPLYWDAPTVGLDRIEMAIIENQNTELSLFEQGQLDWAGSPLSVLPFDAVPSARKNPAFHALPTAATYWYQFNTEVVPFNNKKIRQAFALAINRAEIAHHVSRGTHTPADALIPPQLKHGSIESFSGDAKTLFDEGMHELGLTELPPIILSYNRGDDHHKISQAVQEHWEKTFGITVELCEVEWGIHLSRLRQGHFMVARSYWCAAYADPTDFFNRFRFPTSVGYGAYTGDQWDRKAYADYLDQADNTLDPDERAALLAKAEAVFLEEMPVAPVFFLTSNYLCSSRLKGVVVSPLDRLDFRWASIE